MITEHSTYPIFQASYATLMAALNCQTSDEVDVLYRTAPVGSFIAHLLAAISVKLHHKEMNEHAERMASVSTSVEELLRYYEQSNHLVGKIYLQRAIELKRAELQNSDITEAAEFQYVLSLYKTANKDEATKDLYSLWLENLAKVKAQECTSSREVEEFESVENLPSSVIDIYIKRFRELYWVEVEELAANIKTAEEAWDHLFSAEIDDPASIMAYVMKKRYIELQLSSQ